MLQRTDAIEYLANSREAGTSADDQDSSKGATDDNTEPLSHLGERSAKTTKSIPDFAGPLSRGTRARAGFARLFSGLAGPLSKRARLPGSLTGPPPDSAGPIPEKRYAWAMIGFGARHTIFDLT